MLNTASIALALLLLLGSCAADLSGASSRQAMSDPTRGQLLYETACIGCHTTHAHWRDQRLVRDWPGLIAQVDRWQVIANQNWRTEDIDDVATYLNDQFYRLPCPARVCAVQPMGRSFFSTAH